ncbi:beta-ketoacyl-ACP synthase [Coleofasciculus sp. F4-SAH-05]|uniref:beta-ketoacyl-ACP synthase n=1 Tax=Coleofasciculus sp. F4-SAH-05 TaxID=3069525 RepID=UPI0032FABEE8
MKGQNLGLHSVVVTGIGLISALGGLEQSWLRLLNGESGIRSSQPFPELPVRPLALIDSVPSSLTRLTQVVVTEALADANLQTPMPNCGVVVGSSRGCQASWEELIRAAGEQGSGGIGELFSSSQAWLETLPHQAAIAAARQIGSMAPVFAPMAACATGIWAIARGFELIQTGQCQRVVAGALEAPITRLTLAGFDKMGALAKTGAYPFDQRREGLVLGEGGAVLVLESAELALSRGVPIYGQLLGFGFSCDAYHITTPKSSNTSAITAIQQCLDRSHLSPTEIDYIHAHGTGTRLNDENEAQLMDDLFTHRVAVSSTKGATGHTLGASGAIGVAFCLMALKHQILPPCVGLGKPAFDLDLVTQARRHKVRQLLCWSFGFGGQNAILALGKYSSTKAG